MTPKREAGRPRERPMTPVSRNSPMAASAAVDQLSAASESGGLISAEMAKALYTRGIAYKKLKQARSRDFGSDERALAEKRSDGRSARRRRPNARKPTRWRAFRIPAKAPERVVAERKYQFRSPTPVRPVSRRPRSRRRQRRPKAGTAEGSGPATPITRQDAASEAAQDAARARAAYAPVDALAASTVSTASTARVRLHRDKFASDPASRGSSPICLADRIGTAVRCSTRTGRCDHSFDIARCARNVELEQRDGRQRT